MTLADAYSLLSAAAAAGRVRDWPVEYRVTRDGPAYMAAAAELGGLSEADTLDEIVEAAQRGLQLADIGPAWRARYERALDDIAESC